MLGFLGDLLGLNAGEATKDAAGQNKKIISGYDKQGNKIIDTGAAQAGGYLGQVGDLYDPISGSTQLYADALGLSGSDGTTRAQSAFTTSPGYDFAMDQGLQAIARSASSMGNYASGGTTADMLGYAQGLAGQEYGSWLDRLMGASNTALAGQSGSLTNLANLATGTATQKLGLTSDVANAKMGANNQFAQGEEANKAGIASLGGNLLGMAGKAFGWGGF